MSASLSTKHFSNSIFCGEFIHNIDDTSRIRNVHLFPQISTNAARSLMYVGMVFVLIWWAPTSAAADQDTNPVQMELSATVRMNR